MNDVIEEVLGVLQKMYFCRERVCVNGHDDFRGHLLYRRSSCLVMGIAILLIVLCLIGVIGQNDRIANLDREIKALEISPWLKPDSDESKRYAAKVADTKSPHHQDGITIQPTHIGLSSFLEAVSQQAKKFGMTVESFQPLEERREGAVITSHIKLALEGNFPQFFTYLRQLLTISEGVGFKDLTIETGSNPRDGNSESIQIFLTVAHHYQDQDSKHNKLIEPKQVKPPDSST